MSAAAQSVVSADRPFPGLRPFAYEDHDYFFGREDQIFALYRLIERNRFIAVIGSSGCGKSSLVRAGLVPLLEAETSGPGGRNWLWREMRPGDAPLERLAALLAGVAKDDDPIIASARRERVAAHLRRSSFGVADALTEIGGLGDRSLILVVDQFEELFRYSPSGGGASGDEADDARAREAATKFVQLLLEAGRTREHKVLVMLTMRSDFLGDCARFHGLPEAVSATQFLVPSLSRDQLEEVIRKPVETAGAEIEPELVERLLNDCSTELDQLPVMQHCLLRVWEEAGRPASAGAAGTASTPARRLTIEHYRKIGSFAGALSQHADELLNDLPGPKLHLAIEQTFRALSELDKDGRATRRPVRFAQLLAETGADESDLRRVLDRFRADDCSFLVPSRFEVPAIEATTRIDVGHEALLRRWEKVSGQGAEPGWLRAEQQAGERYRGLLAIADGEGATLPAHLVDERWRWWTGQRRTPAWAERYGGDFARVDRLLRASKARQRVVRFAKAGAFLCALLLAGAMALLWREAVRATNEVATIQSRTTKSTAELTRDVSTALSAGSIPVRVAMNLLGHNKETLEELERARTVNAQIDTEQIRLALYTSDVFELVGQSDEALKLANDAQADARTLLAKHPENPDFKLLVYMSAFRVGDQLAKNADSRERAAAEYQQAFDIAQQLAAASLFDADRQHDLAFAANKLGDMEQLRKNWKGATAYYERSMSVAQAIAEKYPDNVGAQRDVAVAHMRLGQVSVELKDYDAGLQSYRAALHTLVMLTEKHSDDAGILSNRATTLRRIGEVLRLTERYDGARQALRGAVDIRLTLRRRDPGNATWRSALASDAVLLGDVLMLQKDWSNAAARYGQAQGLRQELVEQAPADLDRQRGLATVQDKLGDALAKQYDVAGALKAYNDALATIANAAGDDASKAGLQKLQQNVQAKIAALAASEPKPEAGKGSNDAAVDPLP
jgi:tetratricopeptide (TPR) repeat protein